MTQKELKHMGRRELIELIATMKKNELKLQEQLDDARKQLSDRTIRLSEAGSIAEASLSLSGVFEAAQEAADSYLQSVKTANGEIEERCEHMLQETRQKCDAMVEAANAETTKRWDAFRSAVNKVFQTYPELKHYLKEK